MSAEATGLKKVLLLSASAGAGHLRAAQALERAFRESGAASEVRHVDTLDFTTRVFRNLYSKAYIDAVNKAPELLGWLYDQLDRPWKNERLRLAFDKLNTRPFVQMLKEYQPDITVCTHFLPAEIISWLKAKRRVRCQQSIVVTDLDVHALWLCHHFEHYFVALEETRVHLEQLGIPAEKLTVSGIPIDPVFAQPKDRILMRRKQGLLPDRTTILVSTGGFGVGPIQDLIRCLFELRHPSQIVAICGRNQELKVQLDRLIERMPSNRVALKVVGYTNEMDEYMAASDMILGKPGGLTTSEALAKGLIFVIVNPIPGQEERNADHLLEEGVAIRCNNLPALAYKVDRLLDDPRRLEEMRERARQLARPHAAQTIVRRLLELSADSS
ncbi:MAG: glycosyltransferase [Acidobacteriota bacterium]